MRIFIALFTFTFIFNAIAAERLDEAVLVEKAIKAYAEKYHDGPFMIEKDRYWIKEDGENIIITSGKKPTKPRPDNMADGWPPSVTINKQTGVIIHIFQGCC